MLGLELKSANRLEVVDVDVAAVGGRGKQMIVPAWREGDHAAHGELLAGTSSEPAFILVDHSWVLWVLGIHDRDPHRAGETHRDDVVAAGRRIDRALCRSRRRCASSDPNTG